ncbi:MAG: recombinase family protein [Acutalibacteraceae bacterium]
MITAACYIRVSTDDQTEYSPDSQLKLIRDYCTKNKISLSEDLIFAEDGGKSGKNMTKRTEFMRLISLTKSKPKPFDVLLVWKFSRFARNQEESIVLKSMLKKRGIDVISVSETIPDGPFGSLIERIIEWSDEYYLVNLSQEVKRGMKERASRGEPVTPPPIGYRMKDGGYVPDSDADAIKKIYEDFLAGIGMRAIARKYSDLGLRTKKGNELDNRTIEYILCNPVYTGKIRWSKEGRAASKRHYSDPNVLIFDGKHEPIVDIALFDKVQKSSKSKKSGTENISDRSNRSDT